MIKHRCCDRSLLCSLVSLVMFKRIETGGVAMIMVVLKWGGSSGYADEEGLCDFRSGSVNMNYLLVALSALWKFLWREKSAKVVNQILKKCCLIKFVQRNGLIHIFIVWCLVSCLQKIICIILFHLKNVKVIFRQFSIFQSLFFRHLKFKSSSISRCLDQL